MKVFKLAFRLMYKNAFLHFLLILQMLLVFVIGSAVVSEINGIFYQKNIIKNLGNTNCVFFQGVNERELISGSENDTITEFEIMNTEKVSNELIGSTKFVSEISLFGTSENDGANFNISGFDEILLKNINIPILKGGFKDSKTDDNTVRFITDCKQYRVGDKIPLAVEDYDGNKLTINLLVVGIAKTPFFSPTTTATSTVADASTLLSEYQKSEAGKYISGVFCSNDIGEISAKLPKTFVPVNYYIFFDNSLTNADIEKNIEVLKHYGNAAEISQVLDQTDKGTSETLKVELPNIVFICLITLAGFCGISLLNMSANIRTFALYSILGCSRRKQNQILCVYVFIIETAALVPTLILIFCRFCHKKSANTFHL